MLYIICKNSKKYIPAIEAMCQRVGLINYKIIDPISYDINRSFNHLLIFGEDSLHAPKLEANKKWNIKTYPDKDLELNKKIEILNSFKEIQAELLREKDLDLYMEDDIPRLKDLEEFLKSYKGQVIEIKLSDGRFMGIYQDNERLPMKYPIEVHVSKILNLSKIKDLLDIKQIMFKDL